MSIYNVVIVCVDSLKDSVFALYDIDANRLEESRVIIEAMRKQKGGFGKIECCVGVENRKAAALIVAVIFLVTGIICQSLIT